MSYCWTLILRNVIIDARKMLPEQPFRRKCAGSPTSRCGSNLHTDSIVKLTEYILLFQEPGDIRDTLSFLHSLCISTPNPVRNQPFVIIIACAYINAVANVKQNDIDEFRILLDMVCALCGSLDAVLEACTGGMGWVWPSLELAFDYIRDHACRAGDPTLPQSRSLLHDVGAANNV